MLIINYRFLIQFSLDSSNQTILLNDQDSDRFYFYDLTSNNILDMISFSSTFTQTFTKKDECLLCSFEGAFIKYNYKDKKIKAEKNVKNYINNEFKANSNITNNYMTNPPYISQCLFDISKDEIYFSLLNGVVVALKNNLKTKYVKLVHSMMIRDMRICNFNQDSFNSITLGKEKNIKLSNLEGDIKIVVDLNEYKEEDPFMVESDSQSNLYYVDANSKNLKLIKFKN